MKKRFVLSIISAFLFASPILAQVKQKEQVEQIWAGYFNQMRFSNRWGVWLEGQLRSKEDFVSDLSQAIARVGLTYYLNDATKLTTGYAFVNHFPAAGHEDISQPEHRGWQQLQWHTKYSRVRTMQWFRLEERYRRKVLNNETLADGYNFNFRARYNFLLQVPLSATIQKGSFSAIANNEVHVNFGKEIVNNYFDQNRFFVGLAYHTNAQDNFQFGYMNIFQQLPSGNRYRTTHTIRLYYFHNLDLRKKATS
jgi:hypothetical protein